MNLKVFLFKMVTVVPTMELIFTARYRETRVNKCTQQDRFCDFIFQHIAENSLKNSLSNLTNNMLMRLLRFSILISN